MAVSKKSITALNLAKKVAQLADDKKAQEIKILDMRGLVNFCDFFVIATGTSDRHVQSLAQFVSDELEDLGIQVNLGRGFKPTTNLIAHPEHGAWALLDMSDVVFHVFDANAREFYALEHLWQDAPLIPFKPSTRKK